MAAHLPPGLAAAWRHQGARDGVEVVFAAAGPGDGWSLDGSTAAVEDGAAWWVRYRIEVDTEGRTRRAEVDGRSGGGADRRVLEADGTGRWLVDGVADPRLDGCVDVDLEASACTNTLPVRRLDLVPGEVVTAPAAYVRAEGLAVERLDQTYERVHTADGEGSRVRYRADRFGVAVELRFDADDLVVDYPGLAVRLR